MAGFSALVNCSTDITSNINISDIRKHPRSPFRELSGIQLEQIPVYQSNGAAKAISVKPCAANSDYPYEHYIALCDYNLIRRQQYFGATSCQCHVHCELDDNEAIVEMLTNGLEEKMRLTISERAFAYEMLIQYATDRALQITDECAESFRKIASLTQLTPELLALADSQQISVQAGALLSQLDKVYQDMIYSYLLKNNKRLTLSAAMALCRYAHEIGDLTIVTISDIFSGASPLR